MVSKKSKKNTKKEVTKSDRIRIYNKLKDNFPLQEEIMKKKANEIATKIESMLEFVMYDFVRDMDATKDQVTTKKFFQNKDNDALEYIRKLTNDLTIETLTEGL